MKTNFKEQFKPIALFSLLYLPISFLVEAGSYGIAAGMVLFSFMGISFVMFLASFFVEKLKKYLWGFLLSIPVLFLIGFSVCSYRSII